jgi:hypothetical protein
MKGGTRAAVAIGVGYVLGRRRKMRLATILAAGAATGGIAGLGGAALRRATQALGSTEALGKLGPQFGEIADTVRGDLVDAGKAAAMAAVTGRIDALTDSLHDRAQSLRDPAAAAAGAGEAVRGAGDTVRGASGRERQAARPDEGRRRRDESRAGPDDAGEDGYDEPDDNDAEYDEAEYDEDQADQDRAGQGEAAARRPRRDGSRGRAPIARTRR